MNSDIIMIVALAIGLCIAGILYYLQWRQATPDERREMLMREVARLVDAAEQMHKAPDSGAVKYSWVMSRLTQRFPSVDWETLSEYVEQAVHHMNAGQAARQGVNGKYNA